MGVALFVGWCYFLGARDRPPQNDEVSKLLARYKRWVLRRPASTAGLFVAFDLAAKQILGLALVHFMYSIKSANANCWKSLIRGRPGPSISERSVRWPKESCLPLIVGGYCSISGLLQRDRLMIPLSGPVCLFNELKEQQEKSRKCFRMPKLFG